MAAKTATKKGAKKTAAKKTTTAKKVTAKPAMKAAAKTATAKTATKTAAKTTAVKTTVAKAAPLKAVKAAKTLAPKKRTLNPALKAPYTPSAELAEIVGASPLPRQEVVSKLWTYIKANGLQDKQNINADAKLQAVFSNKKTVTMFEMQKYISNHLTKTV